MKINYKYDIDNCKYFILNDYNRFNIKYLCKLNGKICKQKCASFKLKEDFIQ